MAYRRINERQGQEYALQRGTHALLYKVVKFQSCGCKPDGAGNLPSPVRVVFCKLHRAAPTFLKTLRLVASMLRCNCPDSRTTRRSPCLACAAKKALAKAGQTVKA